MNQTQESLGKGLLFKNLLTQNQAMFPLEWAEQGKSLIRSRAPIVSPAPLGRRLPILVDLPPPKKAWSMNLHPQPQPSRSAQVLKAGVNL